MIVSITQPTLFPWIGYFDIINKADIFVFLDNVKFEKSSWQMRNKLKTISHKKEDELWIRIPTKNVNSSTTINDVLIDNSENWKQKHFTMFKNNYGDKFLEIGFFVKLYERNWEKLAEFNIEFIKNCSNFLGIKTKFQKASEMKAVGKKSELVLNICKELHADEYLANAGSKEYLDENKEKFNMENIKITYHDFVHPKYTQKGNNFIEKLSVLDLLFNEKNNAKQFV